MSMEWEQHASGQFKVRVDEIQLRVFPFNWHGDDGFKWEAFRIGHGMIGYDYLFDNAHEAMEDAEEFLVKWKAF